jgi:hypothetical protein
MTETVASKNIDISPSNHPIQLISYLFLSVLVRLLTYVSNRTKTDQYNSHTTLNPAPTIPQ